MTRSDASSKRLLGITEQNTIFVPRPTTEELSRASYYLGHAYSYKPRHIPLVVVHEGRCPCPPRVVAHIDDRPVGDRAGDGGIEQPQLRRRGLLGLMHGTHPGPDYVFMESGEGTRPRK